MINFNRLFGQQTSYSPSSDVEFQFLLYLSRSEKKSLSCDKDLLVVIELCLLEVMFFEVCNPSTVKGLSLILGLTARSDPD